MTELYEITISGSYRAANNEVIDFANVKGIVPANEEDVMNMHIRRRHAAMFISAATNKVGDALYPKRMNSIRECYIDNMEPVDGEPSYAGMNIKELTMEQLQDLALGKDLRQIPLFKKSSLRHTREQAYLAYAASIGEPVDEKDAEYNFAKLPDLILDGTPRKDKTKKMTNEEFLAREAKPVVLGEEEKNHVVVDPKEELKKLKAVAKAAGITFSNAVTLPALKKKIADAANKK